MTNLQLIAKATQLLAARDEAGFRDLEEHVRGVIMFAHDRETLLAFLHEMAAAAELLAEEML